MCAIGEKEKDGSAPGVIPPGSFGVAMMVEFVFEMLSVVL